MDLIEALSKAQQTLSSISLSERYKDQLEILRTKRDILEGQFAHDKKKRSKKLKREKRLEEEQSLCFQDRIKSARARNQSVKKELEEDASKSPHASDRAGPHLDQQIEYYKQRYRKVVESDLPQWEQASQSRRGSSCIPSSRTPSRNASAVFASPQTTLEESNPYLESSNNYLSPNFIAALSNRPSNNSSPLRNSVNSPRPSVSFSPELEAKALSDAAVSSLRTSPSSIAGNNLEQVIQAVVDRVMQKRSEQVQPLSLAKTASDEEKQSPTPRVVYINQDITKSPQGSSQNIQIQDVLKPKNLDLRVLISNCGAPEEVESNSNIGSIERATRPLANALSDDTDGLSNFTVSLLSMNTLNEMSPTPSSVKNQVKRGKHDGSDQKQTLPKKTQLEALFEYIERFYEGGPAIYTNSTSERLVRDILEASRDGASQSGWSVNSVSDSILYKLRHEEKGLLPKEFIPYIPLHEDFVADFNFVNLLGMAKGMQVQRLINNLRSIIDKDPKVKQSIVFSMAKHLIPEALAAKPKGEVTRTFAKIARFLTVKLPKTMADDDIFVAIEREKIPSSSSSSPRK